MVSSEPSSPSLFVVGALVVSVAVVIVIVIVRDSRNSRSSTSSSSFHVSCTTKDWIDSNRLDFVMVICSILELAVQYQCCACSLVVVYEIEFSGWYRVLKVNQIKIRNAAQRSNCVQKARGKPIPKIFSWK